MAYKDLQHFIRELDNRGELKRITAEVSANLEITEITDRISKEYGPALLFENVTNSKYPVLINAMGTYKRMSLSLGAETLDEIGDKIAKYLDLSNYLSIKRLFKSIPMLFRLLYVFPIKKWGKGACQEVIEHNVDLDTLPVLKCWPQDAERFFTLPLVFTKEYNSKRQNVGMYRMQVLDKTSTGMHWHKHKDGTNIYRGYIKANKKMPISVALGCDPAVTYAATAPLPREIDEMMLAGWLRKRNVKMVKSITNDIYVTADAEIVLEGYVDPSEDLVLEGPFGDHTGYYSLADYYPRFHVTCITHKKNAVFPATIVGKPPMEDCYMAKATERLFLPILKMQIPEMVDLNLPLEGVFHNCAIISVRNTYPGCARKVMNSVWGMGQMMYTKLIVIVDDTVNVQNPIEVRDAILNNVSGKERMILSEGPLDALDHSSNLPLYGCRLGIDATINTAANNKSKTDKIPTYKFISVKKERAGQAKEAIEEHLKNNEDKFVVAFDHDVDINNISFAMWKLFNNVDASRDMVFYGDKIGVDATKKWKEEGLTRGWPDDINMSDDIKERVNRRWNEYGFN